MTRHNCPQEAEKTKSTSPSTVADSEIVCRAYGKGNIEEWFSVAQLKDHTLSVDRELILAYPQIVARQQEEWTKRGKTLGGLMKAEVAQIRLISYADDAGQTVIEDVFCVHDDGDEESGYQHALIGFCCAIASKDKGVLRPLRSQLMQLFRQSDNKIEAP